MIETTAKTERELRRRAFAEATDLFAADGPSAIPAVSKRAKDIAKSDDDRRYDRLTLLELERLARLQTRQQTSHTLGLWTPPAFSFEGIAALLGLMRRPPRKKALVPLRADR